MALTQCMVTSFKNEVLTGTHVFGTDVFKIALYTNVAAWDATTTAYAATNEVSSANYSAGGAVLATCTPGTSGTTAWIDWTVDPSWTPVTLTARSAMIYNSSKSNKAVAIIDFGADKTATSGTFTVQLPTADASNALIRIA